MDSIQVGNDILKESIEICAGDNVKILVDGNKIFISAPMLNQTRLKQGPFILAGQEIEIQAGPNIKISSANPNTLVIGADVSRETLRIIELEKRCQNLELALAGVLSSKQQRKDP